MFRFDNPLDPSKDGNNPFIDGIRYHIRNSEEVKEQVLKIMPEYIYRAKLNEIDNATDILDMMLSSLGYDADDLIIADEHYLLDEIMAQISWLG